MKTTLLILLLTLEAIAGTRIHHPRTTGKEFYIVFPKAAWGNQNVGVLVSSPTAQAIRFSPSPTNHDTVQIASPRTTRYVGGILPIVNVPESTYTAVATHIQSQDPIAALGQFGLGGISGTFTLLPVSSWGTEYYAAAPPEGTNSSYPLYPKVYSVPMITIIGAHAGTTITITPTTWTAKHAQGIPFTITLNAGDVYNITTQGDPLAPNRVENPCQSNLSGTHVVSDFPVGVIVSQSHTSMPCGYNECGDYCVEWLPPVSNLDSIYVVGPAIPRLNNVTGDQIELVCVHYGTDVTVDDGMSDPRLLGTLAAGDVIDYPRPISSPIILRGSQPFMIAQYTTKPMACMADTDGGEPWNLSMDILGGVNQWSDFTPFSTAVGSQSIANIYFKYADIARLKINGKSIAESFPKINHLPEGYASITMTVAEGSYNEITGDSGATAGGSVFGYGPSKFAPGGNRDTAHVLDPEVKKSFAHQIGGNFLQQSNPDIMAPHDSVEFDCCYWKVTGFDDDPVPAATGIYEVWLATPRTADSSYNVRFNPAPVFAFGDAQTSAFHVAIINGFKDAQASLHFRDGAGNEYDTLLTYYAQRLDVVPETLVGGTVGAGDTLSRCITLTNQSLSTLVISQVQLNAGAHWKLTSGGGGLSLPAGVSFHVCVQYVADTMHTFRCDTDTLLLTGCCTWPVATMSACNIRPAVYAIDHYFGARYTNKVPPDSASELVMVMNTGTDTLHVTGATLRNTSTPDSDNDFRITGVVPTVAKPWAIAPGDSAGLAVSALPIYDGTRTAYIYFASDAHHITNDTSRLQMFGMTIPSAVHQATEQPGVALLAENYPNPFTDATTIAFDAPEGNYVVAIFNSIGEKVGEVGALRCGDGKYSVTWNAGSMPGGMYFYRVAFLQVSGKFMVVK